MKHFLPGADAAVGIGLIGAGAAAVAGLNDWQFTNDKPKRVGALHAILNISATLCYLGSWWQRRNGHRHEGIFAGLARIYVNGSGRISRRPSRLQGKDRGQPRAAGIAREIHAGDG